MKRLLIVGAGGMGREVYQCAKQINAMDMKWDIVGFLDPDSHALDGKKCDISIIGDDFDYAINDNDEFVCAIGDGKTRKSIIERLELRGAKFTELIHPSAIIADNVEIGKGTIVFANSIISDNTFIGKGCFINFQTSIGHDVLIQDYCTFFSNCVVCGGCIIGSNVTLGTASNVIPGINVASNAYVCAGSTVMRNVRENARVIGVPAGPMRIGDRK